MNLLEKKSLGAFYSPPDVTRLISDWAIQRSSEYILEPSFGGCGFFKSSMERLKSLGVSKPVQHIFGCDCSRQAFDIFKKDVGPVEVTNKFLQADFLSISPKDFYVEEFDAVIGNPPYISRHNMAGWQRDSADAIAERYDYNLKGNVSLWPWFVLHSLNFLKPSGRLAFILPFSLIHSQYGRQVLDILASKFNRVLLIQLKKRLFVEEGTSERSMLLFAEGAFAADGEGKVSQVVAEDLRKAEEALREWSCNNATNVGRRNAKASQSMSLAYEVLRAEADVKRLSELARVSIGFVTGANRFFILDEENVRKLGIPSSCIKKVLSSVRQMPGLKFSTTELGKATKSGERTSLIDTSKMTSRHNALAEYLSSFPEEDRVKNITFTRRPIWHSIDVGPIPDMFFTPMNHYCPRMAINSAGVACSNSLYGVYMNRKLPRYKLKLMAISMFTTFSQLSAEIEGRHYGAGVLKLEPGEARKIFLYLPETIPHKKVNAAFKAINALVQRNDIEAARQMADSFLLGKLLGKHGDGLLSSLELELQRKRDIRYR